MNSITIALCTYNGARYLDEQLLTLRAQEGVNEIVVVDDRSADGTWSILERHAAADARIRLHRNPLPLGVTRNFERAIGLVRGEWVALADQDDVWLPGKLAHLRAAWDGQAVLLHHATHKFHGAVPPALPSPAGERRKFSGGDLRRLLYRNSIVGHTVLVRTGVARQLMPFPPGVLHDWWIGVGAAVRGGVQYVDEYLVHYRIHAANAFHTAGSRWRRRRVESAMRIALLQALQVRGGLPPEGREFSAKYLALLQACPAGVFPWRLWHFYLGQARLFFGSAGFAPSKLTSFRKSCAAALGAMLWAPPAGSSELHRPPLVSEPRGVHRLRRTG